MATNFQEQVQRSDARIVAMLACLHRCDLQIPEMRPFARGGINRDRVTAVRAQAREKCAASGKIADGDLRLAVRK